MQKFTLLIVLLCVLPALWRVLVGVRQQKFVRAEPATVTKRPAEQELRDNAFADSTAEPSYSNA